MDTDLSQRNPWASLPTEPPFVAEVDRRILDDEYIIRYRLDSGVMPHAWIGDPRSARVVILQLNPSIGAQDARQEQEYPNYRALVRDCLLLRSHFPFWVLDPELDGTGAQAWWKPRLRPLIAALGPTGTKVAVNRVAVVEYFPYHSLSYHWPPRIPSQGYGFALVNQAVSNGAVILVMRQWEHWRASVPALIGYQRCHINRHPRSAHISRANLGDIGFDAAIRALLHET